MHPKTSFKTRPRRILSSGGALALTAATAVAAVTACGEASRNFTGAGGSAGASAGGARSSGGSASPNGGSTISSGGVGGSSNSGGTSELGGAPIANGGSAGGGDTAGAGGTDSAGAGGTEEGGRGEGGQGQGGAPAVGGAPPMGGTGTGGVANSFRGGPCAVSPDKQSVEVFARGRDTNIYRAVVGTTTPKWERLADLDGSLIDNRSDLDCSATTTAVHLVALGRTPPNSFLHATGSGTSYNPFERDLTDYTLGSTPSVFQGFQTILAGTDTVSGTFVFSRTPEGVTSDERDGRIILFSSGIDAWWTTFAMTDVQFFAGFTSAGTLSVQMLQRHVGGQTWRAPAEVQPPSGLTFEYSPTVCGWYSQATSPPKESEDLIAVAGGLLWHASATGVDQPYSAWEKMSNNPVSSAPDCTVTTTTTGGYLHVVALSQTGTVLDVRGTTGAFTTTDLGAY